MAYLLDANIFIQAKNLHYGFDFCPAFWTWLDEKRESGVVTSVSQIGDEACLSLKVPFCSPYQMLRKERARFVLGKGER